MKNKKGFKMVYIYKPVLSEMKEIKKGDVWSFNKQPKHAKHLYALWFSSKNAMKNPDRPGGHQVLGAHELTFKQLPKKKK